MHMKNIISVLWIITTPFFGYEHEHAYFSQEINGYKLIVMATEADSKIQAYHSEEQLRWLENELADAAASGKPHLYSIISN